MRYLFLSILAGLILSVLWFGHGNLMGGGEAGILFYNLANISDISFPAWGNQILGGASGITSSSGPLFLLLSNIQNYGIQGNVLEAFVFFMMILITVLGMDFFYTALFDVKRGLNSWISGLFYLFNLFSLMNIWNRFLPNTMVFYAVLPLVLGLYIKGVKSKRLVCIILASLLTAVFSYGFAAPAQTLIFLGLITLLYLFEFFINRNYWLSIKYYFISLVSWGLFNFWWIFQQVSFRFSTAYTTVSDEFFSSSGNFDTFLSLSGTLGQLKNLFLLKHGTFFSQSLDMPYSWPLFYDLVPSLIIEWGIMLAVLYVAIKHLKNKSIVFLLSIFIIGMIGAKGSVPPFGEIFRFLFEKVTYIQFFRNPFEKLGLLLPLALSPLLGFSVGNLYEKYGKKVLVIVGLYLFVFLGFPFWTKLVFTSGNPPANDLSVGYQVKVPDYYKQADEWFSSQKGLFRFMSLPLGGEGIFYKWPKGYVGVEQSGVLFKTPSISYDTTISFYHQIVTKLQQLFLIYKNFPLIANLLNIRYTLYRPDFDFKLSGMRDPQSILDSLNSRYPLLKEFGPLKVYDFENSNQSEKIYPARFVVATNKIGDMEDVLTGDLGSKDILIRSKDRDNFAVSKDIVHNISFFEIDAGNYPKLVDAPDIFPYVSRLPDDKIYPLILIKEKLMLMTKTDVQQNTREKVTLLGKRLMEVKKLKDKGNLELSNKYLKLYLENLSRVLDTIDRIAEFKLPTDIVWRQDDMFNVFSSHLNVLKSFGDEEALAIFKRMVSDHKILPYWDFQSKSGNRVVYQFEAPVFGEYELIIPKTLSFPQVFSVDGIKFLQLDDKLITAIPEIMENYLKLGRFIVAKGSHEISFLVPTSRNLLPITELIMDTQIESRREIPINDYDPFLRYQIGFDYLVEYGDGLNVDLVLNTDALDHQTKKPRRSFSRKFNRDSYSSLVQSFSFVLGGSSTSDTANLTMWVDKWNNCRDLFSGKYAKKCDDKKIYDWFNRPTRIKISNIRVKPKFPAQARLISAKQNIDLVRLPEIVFEKIGSTKYTYKVRNATSPFLLVFSELFDAGWRITDSSEHFLVNGYANAWKINKTGNFQGEIEFYPQKLLRIGYMVSGVSIAFGLIQIFYLVTRHKNT